VLWLTHTNIKAFLSFFLRYRAGSSTADDGCVECLGGTYSDTCDKKPCQPHPVLACATGEYPTLPLTNQAQECVPCPLGVGRTVVNYCSGSPCQDDYKDCNTCASATCVGANSYCASNGLTGNGQWKCDPGTRNEAICTKRFKENSFPAGLHKACITCGGGVANVIKNR
jgi:hypothetical protein